MRAIALLLTASLAACRSGDKAPATVSATAADTALAPALAAITNDGLMDHTKALSDDSLEGRALATPGEEKIVACLQRQFIARTRHEDP